jgi:hypothetical protein
LIPLLGNERYHLSISFLSSPLFSLNRLFWAAKGIKQRRHPFRCQAIGAKEVAVQKRKRRKRGGGTKKKAARKE